MSFLGFNTINGFERELVLPMKLMMVHGYPQEGSDDEFC